MTQSHRLVSEIGILDLFHYSRPQNIARHQLILLLYAYYTKDNNNTILSPHIMFNMSCYVILWSRCIWQFIVLRHHIIITVAIIYFQRQYVYGANI